MATKKKTTKKRTTKKKTGRTAARSTRTTRNTAARKTTTKKKTAKLSAAGEKPRTKSQIFSEIADQTELSKRDIAEVFDVMTEMIKMDLGRRGPGVFTVPGLMKIEKKHKPRRPARKGINPFTGEPTTFAAKPAHNVVKVRPLKNLKEMV